MYLCGVFCEGAQYNAYVYRDQKSALCVLRMISTLYFEIESLTDLELANMIKLAGQ